MMIFSEIRYRLLEILFKSGGGNRYNSKRPALLDPKC